MFQLVVYQTHSVRSTLPIITSDLEVRLLCINICHSRDYGLLSGRRRASHSDADPHMPIGSRRQNKTLLVFLAMVMMPINFGCSYFPIKSSSLLHFLLLPLLLRQLTHKAFEGYIGSRDKLEQICIFSVFMAMGQIARFKCLSPSPSNIPFLCLMQ